MPTERCRIPWAFTWASGGGGGGDGGDDERC